MIDREREDQALDALIASFCIEDDVDQTVLDDPSVLTDEDRKAIDALGDDLIDRFLTKEPLT